MLSWFSWVPMGNFQTILASFPLFIPQVWPLLRSMTSLTLSYSDCDELCNEEMRNVAGSRSVQGGMGHGPRHSWRTRQQSKPGYSPNCFLIHFCCPTIGCLLLLNWYILPQLAHFTYTINCTLYTVCYTDLEKPFFVNSQILKCTFGGGKNV